MSIRPMRFATQSGSATSGQAWIERAKRLETLGYDTLAMPDHMIGGAWAAMPALAVAATATHKLRVGTLVVDNDFRNPTAFARECATLDVLTNGRFELGIGAGWLDRDYQSTGIPFDRGRVRVGRLAEAVTLLKRLFTEEQVTLAELAKRAKAEPDALRNSAYRGIGTLREIRDHIVRVRDAIGITYFCLRGPNVESLGPVVAELTGR